MSSAEKQLCYMLSKADRTWPVNHLQFFQADECRIECSLGSIFLSEPTQVWQSSNRVQPVFDNHSGMEQEKERVWTRFDPSGTVWNSLGMHAFLVVTYLMSAS